MKKTVAAFLIGLALGSLSLFRIHLARVAHADEAAAAPASAGNPDPTLRCERMTGSLPEFKARLVTYCNLDKPYSFAYSDSALGDKNGYVYCCRLKAQ